MVDEPYKDGSGSEHWICQTYKLALYLYALRMVTGEYSYGLEDHLYRSQGLTAASTPATINSVRTLEHRRTQRQPPSPSQQSPISLRQDRSRSHSRSSTFHHG